MVVNYPLANVPSFKNFNFHHKDRLSYSGGTDRFGELCYNFSISNKLTQTVNFPVGKTDCDSHSLSLLDFFPSTGTSLCHVMFVILHWKFLAILVSLFPLFLLCLKGNAPFHGTGFYYTRANDS